MVRQEVSGGGLPASPSPGGTLGGTQPAYSPCPLAPRGWCPPPHSAALYRPRSGHLPHLRDLPHAMRMPESGWKELHVPRFYGNGVPPTPMELSGKSQGGLVGDLSIGDPRTEQGMPPPCAPQGLGRPVPTPVRLSPRPGILLPPPPPPAIASPGPKAIYPGVLGLLGQGLSQHVDVIP